MIFLNMVWDLGRGLTKMCLCDRESPVGNPLHNSKFKFRACPYRPRRSSFTLFYQIFIGVKVLIAAVCPVINGGDYLMMLYQLAISGHRLLRLSMSDDQRIVLSGDDGMRR